MSGEIEFLGPRLLGGRDRTGQNRVLAGASIAAPSLLAGVVGTLALFLAFDSNPALGRTSYRVQGLAGYAALNQTETYSSHLSFAFATQPIAW